MRINIKGTQISLTDSIKDYLYKRLEGLGEMIDTGNNEATAHVELGKISHHHRSGDIFRAEINIMAEGKSLRAVSEAGDLYSSIDDMKDEIFQEVKKQKSRKRSLIRRGGHRMKDMMRGLFRRK